MGLLYHIYAKRKRTAAGTSCPLRALSHIGEGKGFGYHADLAAQGLEQLIFLVPFAEGVRLERVQHSGASVCRFPDGGTGGLAVVPGAGRPELYGEQMNILLLPFGALHIVDSHGVHPVFPGVPVTYHDLGMSPQAVRQVKRDPQIGTFKGQGFCPGLFRGLHRLHGALLRFRRGFLLCAAAQAEHQAQDQAKHHHTVKQFHPVIPPPKRRLCIHIVTGRKNFTAGKLSGSGRISEKSRKQPLFCRRKIVYNKESRF